MRHEVLRRSVSIPEATCYFECHAITLSVILEGQLYMQRMRWTLDAVLTVTVCTSSYDGVGGRGDGDGMMMGWWSGCSRLSEMHVSFHNLKEVSEYVVVSRR